MMRAAALIYNPTAGGRRALARRDAALQGLAAAGWHARLLPTGGPGHATMLAREAAAQSLAAIFVLGGDGTVREAAKGLLGLAGSAPPLGILAGGTTNVLARELGLPLDPARAAGESAFWSARPFDVGLYGEEPFLMMVSAGLDAAALANQHSWLKRRLGRLGVVAQGLAAWWTYDFPALTLSTAGESWKATFAAVSNISRYGGSFKLAPAAKVDDGRLELVSFSGTGRLATLAFAAAVATGRHLRRPDVRALPVTNVTLNGPRGLRVQADGDLLAPPPGPVAIRLAAQRLTVLAP